MTRFFNFDRGRFVELLTILALTFLLLIVLGLGRPLLAAGPAKTSFDAPHEYGLTQEL